MTQEGDKTAADFTGLNPEDWNPDDWKIGSEGKVAGRVCRRWTTVPRP